MHTPNTYTFQTFLPGNCNQAALDAARRVASNRALQTCYLYGPSGVGKSHLLYAIANAIAANRPELEVTYIKAEDFTSELIHAIHRGENATLRAKYQQLDVLLVDDIQFIAGKEATQEAFFRIFDSMIRAGGQVVVSSDRSHEELSGIDHNLSGLFTGGTCARLLPPDPATRLSVVENRCEAYGLQLSRADQEFLAQGLPENMRLVEGGMKRLLAYRDLMGLPVNHDTVYKVICDMGR